MTEETKLMLEIAKIRVFRKAKEKMLDRLQLRQSLLNELRELKPYKNSQSMQDLFNSEQYISKAKEYCDLLHKFAEGNKEFDGLFDVLDCLKLDSNYTLALHLANDNIGIGDVSWFYCYEGNNDIYCERFNHPDDESDEGFFQCFGNLSEFDIFEHLTVDKTEMGAWQAFLLSIALSQLPVVWHGAYRKQNLIFTNEDLERLHLSTMVKFFQRQNKTEFNCTDNDLLPKVWFEADTAYVRSCYFSMWKGVVRQTTALHFNQNRVIDFEKTKTEVLHEFDCGWKL